MTMGKGPACWSCGKRDHDGQWMDVGGGTDGYFCTLTCFKKYPPYEGDLPGGLPTESDCAAEGMDKERRNY